jgi:alpha-N-arabinofuranosidase
MWGLPIAFDCLSRVREGKRSRVRSLSAAILAATVVLSLAASARAADNADIEIYNDYVVGQWQMYGSIAQSTTDIVKLDLSSLDFTLQTNSPVGFSHTWGGFKTTGYTAVEFWFMVPAGGSANNVGVQAEYWGQYGPIARILDHATLTPGQWTLVRIPLSALGASPTLIMKGLAFVNTGSAQRRFYVDNLRISREAPPAITSVTVRAGNVLRGLTDRMFSIATFCWDPWVDKIETIDRMKEAGFTMLTFPGGSGSDQYDWRTSSSTVDGTVSAIDTRAFLKAAKKVGAQKTFTVNYGSGTPQLAADWVHYANVELRGDVLYWVIGNEVFGAWEHDTHPIPHDALTYAAFVRDCFTLMKAIDPRIKIGVTGTINPSEFPQRVSVINPRTGQSENGWGPVLLDTLRSYGVTPDFYDFHFYPSGPSKESDAYLLQSTDLWNVTIPVMRQTLRDYLGEKGDKVSIYINETNSIYWFPGKQSTSLVSALFLADTWGRAALAGAGCFTWWNLHNATNASGNSSPTLYGWRTVGDYGVLSRGYPAEIAEPANTPYPTFYAYKLLKQFARPGDRLVEATSNNPLLCVYAAMSKNSDHMRILVINKSKNSDITAAITASGFRTMGQIAGFRYGIPEDLNMDDMTQFTVPAVNSFVSTPVRTLTFPKYSLTVLEF